MGASIADGQATDGTDGRAIHEVSVDTLNRHTNYESRQLTNRESHSTDIFTPTESPHSEPCTSRRLPAVDAFATAEALGSVYRQDGDSLDMVCVGFGPASLAIAIALADTYSKSSRPLPKVLFIEKQDKFSWHSGMQLPSAKMQISFLKDLATPRDPTSPFTFLNYLHFKGRLNQFINLGTFLPTRLEYEDYMRWCAGHFGSVVMYGSQITTVDPDIQDPTTQKTQSFKVRWKNNHTLETGVIRSKHVIVAAGGEANIPEEFKSFMALPYHRVGHSSQYATSIRVLEDVYRKPIFLRQQRATITKQLSMAWVGIEEEKFSSEDHHFRIEPIGRLERNKQEFDQQQQQKKRLVDLEKDAAEACREEDKCKKTLKTLGLHTSRPRFVVVGNGQSAAEIFSDLWNRFPDSEISMIIKGAALRPSDDSPFVNEIFNPERVDDIYCQIPIERKEAIALDKGTNYGVVRLELLEHIYEQMYMQRIQEPNPANWRCKILSHRKVTGVSTSQDESSLVLKLSPTRESGNGRVEELFCEHVFVATGYTRNAYQEILKDTRVLLPENHNHHDDTFPVGRDYSIMFDKEKVDSDAGIWLQGCNESTHGLSDTLLSILAVRGGEIVQSIFGHDLAMNGGRY